MRLKRLHFSTKISKRTLNALFAIFPAVFYLVNLYRMTTGRSLLYRLTIFLFGITGILKSVLSKKINISFFLFALFYFSTGLLNYVIIGNLALNDLVSDILLFGIAYIMLVYIPSYEQEKIFFYITIFVFFVFYMKGANTHIVLTSSGNYISVLVIIAVSLYYISLQQHRGQMSLTDVIPACLCFLISIWAKGRGGILSTGLLTVLMMVLLISQTANGSGKKLLLFFLILTIATMLYFSGFSFINWFLSLGKWRIHGANDSARAFIWGSYFSKVGEDSRYLLFGAPLKDIPPIAAAGGNCHNSFLQLHAHNGLIMIFVFFIYLFRAFVYYIRNKKWIMASILFVFCIRAFTDKFIFGQYGMPLMLFFIIKPYYRDKNSMIPIHDIQTILTS